MKVSDYRKMLKKVDTKGGDVVLEHLHGVYRGERQYWNVVIMRGASADSVYRFLNGFDIMGRIDEGVFYGRVDDKLECDENCGEPVVQWQYNWKEKTDTLMVKEGKMTYKQENMLAMIHSDVAVKIKRKRASSNTWHVNYVFEGERVRENFIRSSSQRYVMSKVIEQASEVFEEHFWEEWRKKYRL